jgi:CRISPR system Cascade subunit CasB
MTDLDDLDAGTEPVDRARPGDARSLFYVVAGGLRGGSITSGDRASLRRMDPMRLDAPGFWKVAGLYLDDALPGESSARTIAETGWGTVAVALASLGELQVPHIRLGHVLADAGYSEQRFVRLLRADRTRLVDELPQLARFLAARNLSADFVDAALLLVGTRPEDARRRLARDYYASLSKTDT